MAFAVWDDTNGKPTITWDFDSDPFRGSRFKEYIR